MHWSGRFVASIRPGRPAASELAWAATQLSAEEILLFGRMSNPDQRHSIAVARRAEPDLVALGLDEGRLRAALAAALLHDVGKGIAGLRTYGRVAATMAGALAGHDMADAWQQTSGFTRKVGLYLNYPRLGAELLELHRSDPWVIAWAAHHHDDPIGGPAAESGAGQAATDATIGADADADADAENATVPAPVAAILRSADR